MNNNYPIIDLNIKMQCLPLLLFWSRDQVYQLFDFNMILRERGEKEGILLHTVEWVWTS